MAFQFRLEAVRKVNEFKRDSEKQMLSELLNEQNSLLEKEKSLREQLEETRKERADWMRSANFTAMRLQQYFSCESHLTQCLKELRNEQNRVAAQIELQRESVVKAEQEVKKLEKLEAKQREEYVKAHSRE